VNSDPKIYSALGGHAGVAFDHRVLNFYRAAHGVDDATKLDESAVAGALDDAAVMHVDGRIDQVAAKRPQPRQCPILIGASQSAESDHVRREDRRKFPGLGHDIHRNPRTASFGPPRCGKDITPQYRVSMSLFRPGR
jgi:hypothetical protein